MTKLKKFKKGDKVVMTNCMEGNHPDNHGKIWTCTCDSYKKNTKDAPEIVFLEGFSGSFHCEFLQFVRT